MTSRLRRSTSGRGRAARPAPKRTARRTKSSKPKNLSTRRFVIVTGLSGSGKTHALRALEDLGYFCIDNLPTQLIPTLAELAGRDDRQLDKVALVIDIREGSFLQEFPAVFRRLQGHPRTRPFLIYLEASHSSLVRRFSETRRPHPLAPDRSVSEGIRDEQAKMAAIRALADMTVDTSKLTVHELRDIFTRMSREGEVARAEMVVTLLSFGFKNGLPEDADLAFDVRCLPNPHFVEHLRPLTGRDQPVVRYMRRSAETRAFIAQLTSFLKFSLPQYVREGKTYLTVAIGCTGGRHRSVMIAETLKRELRGVAGVRLRVKHRDS